MSVTSVSVKHSGRSGSSNSKGERTYETTLLVRTNNALDGQTTILKDPRIPQQLSYYQYNGGVDRQALVENVTCTQDDQSPMLWEVVVSYSTLASGQGNNPEFSKSIDLTPKYSWGEYADQKVIDRDIKGKPVVNSAGEMFDPPLTLAIAYPLLRISRAELTFNPLVIMEFKSSINSTQWGSWPAFSAMCVAINANQEVQEGVQFWRVTYEFAFKLAKAPLHTTGVGLKKRTIVKNNQIKGVTFDVVADNSGGWVEYILDRGTMSRELEPRVNEKGSIPSEDDLVLSEPRAIRDYAGTLASSPVLLDGAGGRLIKNGYPLNPSDPNSPKPWYIPFHVRPEKDFNLLQINPNPR